MRVAVLTISDSRSIADHTDASGDAIAAWVAARGYELAARALVPDDTVEIVRTLLDWCDGDAGIALVLTTGGTGLAPRDVTPEATRSVLEREAPGIAERLRVKFMDTVPNAALSRGLAGTRGRTLIVNLPGSPKAVRDCLSALEPIVAHAIALVRSENTTHEPPGAVPHAPRPMPQAPL